MLELFSRSTLAHVWGVHVSTMREVKLPAPVAVKRVPSGRDEELWDRDTIQAEADRRGRTLHWDALAN